MNKELWSWSESSLASSRARASSGLSFRWLSVSPPALVSQALPLHLSKKSHPERLTKTKWKYIYQELVAREADQDKDSAVRQSENKEVAAEEEKLNVKIIIRKQNPRGEEIFKIEAEKVKNIHLSRNCRPRGWPRRGFCSFVKMK